MSLIASPSVKLGRAGAALAAVIVATSGLGFVASPAVAAPISFGMADSWLTPGMTAASPGRKYSVLAVAEHAERLTMVFDLSGLGTAVAVTPAPDCTTAGAKLTCPVHALSVSDGTVTLVLRAGATAAAGAVLPLRATVSGPGIDTATATAEVRIVHGADLIPDEEHTAVQAATSRPVTLPVRFTNWGDRAADGFFLRLGWSLPFQTDVPGCEPVNGEPPNTRCKVAERVAVGGRYAGTPFTFTMGRATGDLPVGYGIEPLDAPAGVGYGFPRAWFDLHVVSGTVTDIALEGGAATGEAGQTVTIPLTIRNFGPADSGTDGAAPRLAVRFESPTGTEVVALPDRCQEAVPFSAPYPNGAALLPATECYVPSVASGGSYTWNLQFKIVRKVPGAYGRVDFHAVYQTDFSDPVAANDTTRLTVNGAPALPVTGTQAGWLAAGGVGTVLAGAALLVWARRRRVVLVVAGDR